MTMEYRLTLAITVPDDSARLAPIVANALRAHIDHLDTCVLGNEGPERSDTQQVTCVVDGVSYDVEIGWKMQGGSEPRARRRGR